MSQRRIYELFYPDFSSILRKATDAHKTIEKSNKVAWADYVRKHNVPEPTLMVRGKAGTLSGKVSPVIIDGAGSADGYYVYSSDEEFCLKFESGQE